MTDLLFYKGGPALFETIALTHMTINLIAVALFAVNIWLRTSSPESMTVPVLLSIAGVGLIAVSDWLGVGVEGRE